jgi:trehalose/maltose transport system substrate-binding protein
MRNYSENVRVAMTRREAATLMALAAVSACTGRGPAPDGTGPVTLNWPASTITNREQEPRQALIDAFERVNPSISVALVSAPTNTDEAREKIREELSCGEGTQAPDLYLGDVIWPAEFARAGIARPLDDLFKPAFWTRFPEELVTAASYNGKTYAAPFYVDQGILLYRKDLLAQEGLPNPPKTWEDLEHAAKVLLKKGKVDYGFVWQGAEYEGLTCVWTEFSAEPQRRGVIGPPREPDERPIVDTPQSRAGLIFMRRLLTSGVSPLEVTSFREAQSLQAFQIGSSGRGAAFQRAWNSAYFDVLATESPVRGKVGVAPLPVFSGQSGPGASTIGGWSLYVNPRTEHLAQVRDFIDWMTAPAAQFILTEYSVNPTNKNVRDDSAVRRHPEVAASVQARPVHRPSFTPEYRQVSRAINAEVHKALLGVVTPAEALQAAQRRIDDIVRNPGSAAPDCPD